MRHLFTAITFIAITTPALADEYVQGHYRQNGTYVQPYHRSSPDNSVYNNYSTRGNVNPYTGQVGTVNPYQQQEMIYLPVPPNQFNNNLNNPYNR